MKRRAITVLITDLDNTLFDWVAIWYASFRAMLDKIIEISGVSEDKLIPEIKLVHEKHGTSEYAFLIEELPSLAAAYPNENLIEKFKPAIDAYRAARERNLKLYPGVLETLQTIRDSGALVVGYTESMAFYSNYRVRKLGLDGLLDFLYSPSDHDLPQSLTREQIRKYPARHYEFRYTEHRYTPLGEFKPNSAVLLDIIRNLEADPKDCIYIGDSLLKDVLMAKDASIVDILAKYGNDRNGDEYTLLKKVTHWKLEDVSTEQSTTEDDVNPTFVFESGFSELLANFSFGSFASEQLPPASLDKQIEAWKKTVDVQQHFNEIELKIRNLAIIITAALFGAVGYAIKEKLMVDVGCSKIHVGFFMTGAALFFWIAFYLMDRWWYHRLLQGAVKHGLELEQRIGREIPGFSLTKSIGDASPVHFLWLRVRSDQKIDIFYLLGALVITAIIVAMWRIV